MMRHLYKAHCYTVPLKPTMMQHLYKTHSYMAPLKAHYDAASLKPATMRHL